MNFYCTKGGECVSVVQKASALCNRTPSKHLHRQHANAKLAKKWE